MNTLRLYPTNINSVFIDRIVDTLKNGGIIVYPTDTFYAIGCDALNNRAIERLCKIKGINPDKQLLSIVCSDISQASEYARIDNNAFRILRSNLPGPFTFILPAASTLPKVFKGRKTVGVRVPDNNIARAIAATLGNPVLTTSIPIEGMEEEEIIEPMSIALNMEDVADIMVDGGQGDNRPSTVVDCLDSSAPEVVREGKGILA